MSAAANPVAFLSYVRFNDNHDEQAISVLCDKLAAEVHTQTGLPFLILRDKKDISWGERWTGFIDKGIELLTLLIVVVTPSYFRSSACRREYELFRRREQALGRDDLVLPLYYVESDEFEDMAICDASPWASDLRSRQWADWRQHRLQPLASTDVRPALVHLARQIRGILKTSITRVAIPEGGVPLATQSPLSTDGVEKAVAAFNALTPTQNTIIQYLYGITNLTELSLDKLFEAYQERKDRQLIKSKAELYYRVKDLANQGLLSMESKGWKSTVLYPIPAIREVLNEHHLLESD